MKRDISNLPDATWELDDEGKLTIGPGVIRRGDDGRAPWADVADQVRSIEMLPRGFSDEGDDTSTLAVPPADSTRLFAGMPNLEDVTVPGLAMDCVRDATEMFADDPKLGWAILPIPDYFNGDMTAVLHMDRIFAGDSQLKTVPSAVSDNTMPWLESADGALDGTPFEGSHYLDVDRLRGHTEAVVGSVMVTRDGLGGVTLRPAEGPDATGVLPEPSKFDDEGHPVWPWQETGHCNGVAIQGSIRFPEDCSHMFAYCAGREGFFVGDLPDCDLTQVRDISHMFDGAWFASEDVRDALLECDLPSLERAYDVVGTEKYDWREYDEAIAEHARECGAERVTTEPAPGDAVAPPERPLADYDGPDDDGEPGDDLGIGD